MIRATTNTGPVQGGGPPHRELAQEIADLTTMTTTDLGTRFAEVFGRPTKSRDGAWLRQKIARHLAAEVQVARPAERLAVRRAVARARTGTAPAEARYDPRIPPPGTVIRRDHRGEAVEVKVTRTGFSWRGREYRSLSAVARAVTGARWNGLLWAGLIVRNRRRRREGRSS